MSITRGKILKNLLAVWPNHTVATTPWLKQQNVSSPLIQKYLRSGWIQTIGSGAFIKDSIDWEGGISALQSQLNLNIHIGGLSSLDILGRSHYLKFGPTPLYIFTTPHKKIPKWFLTYPWSKPLRISHTSLLKTDKGLISHTVNGIPLVLSSPERAALELLYTTPQYTSYEEVRLIFEHLTDLHPDLMQELLQECRSIKIKRLFLFLMEGQPWMKNIKIDRINLGTSIFPLEKGGHFIRKYKLIVPKEIADKNAESLF